MALSCTFGCVSSPDFERNDHEYWRQLWDEGRRDEKIAALTWFAARFVRPGMPKDQVEEMLGVAESGTHGSHWYGVRDLEASLILHYRKRDGVKVVKSARFEDHSN